MTQTSSYKSLHLYTEIVSGNLFYYLTLHHNKKQKTLTHSSQIAGRVAAVPRYPPVLTPPPHNNGPQLAGPLPTNLFTNISNQYLTARHT
jgi:hypothetical protein